METKMSLDTKTLADVIFSSAMTLAINYKSSKISSGDSRVEELPKVISFNLEREYDLFVNENKLLYDLKNGEFYREPQEILNAVKQRIEEVINGKDIEFINQDPITKSVNVFTESYVDRLINKEVPIGELIINYFNQWYSAKCGMGRKGTREHHEKFKTFSQREIDYLKHMYIPIITISKDLRPIYNSVKTLMEVSPIADFLVTDIGYNINGGRVEGSKTFWLPRIVAKEYLEETDDFKILSKSILVKLVTDAGLLGDAPITNHKVISKELFSNKGVKEMVDNFILSKHGLSDEDAEKNRIKQLISYDIDKRDNEIPEDIGDITLDY